MAQGEALRLVTGNRLRDGASVYYAGPMRWSLRIDEAVLVPESEAEALLAAALDVSPPHPTVAPYLIEAVSEGGHVQPLSLRERIRAFGPTI